MKLTPNVQIFFLQTSLTPEQTQTVQIKRKVEPVFFCMSANSDRAVDYYPFWVIFF